MMTEMKMRKNQYGIECPSACKQNAFEFGSPEFGCLRKEYVEAHKEAAEETLKEMERVGHVREVLMTRMVNDGWGDSMKNLQATVRAADGRYAVIEWHDSNGGFMELSECGGKSLFRC